MISYDSSHCWTIFQLFDIGEKICSSYMCILPHLVKQFRSWEGQTSTRITLQVVINEYSHFSNHKIQTISQTIIITLSINYTQNNHHCHLFMYRAHATTQFMNKSYTRWPIKDTALSIIHVAYIWRKSVCSWYHHIYILVLNIVHPCAYGLC